MIRRSVALGLFVLLLLAGCATSSPPTRTAQLIATAPATSETELDFNFAFCRLGHGALGLCVTVENRGESTIFVDWDQSSLVIGNEAHPVIHKGVRYAARAATTPPSAIPAGSTLRDFVYPRDMVVLVPLQWRGAKVFEEMPDGMRFGLMLALRRGGAHFERYFTFEMKAAEAVRQ